MTAAEQFRMNVRQVCEQKHITQDVLAQRSGLNRVSINRILQGRTVPNIDTCAAIAAAIEEDIGHLLSEPAQIF